MQTHVNVEDLVIANRPRQLALLERAAETFTQCAAVTHLSIRGSLATGTADRMSDLDLVIGIEDGSFEGFVSALDSLMAVSLNALFPAWRDTMIRRMGGLGYVYLVVYEGSLYEFDLYLAPASRVASVQQTTRARLIYAVEPQASAAPPARPAADFIEVELARPRSCSDLLIEILVLLQMVRKCIRRDNHFVTYSDTQLVLCAVKDLIKTALAPHSVHWGWYHLHEDLGSMAVGRACLDDLLSLVSNPPLFTPEALRGALAKIERIAELAAPAEWVALATEVEAYKHYLDLA